MDAVVSRFGLKAENSLRVRINDLPGGLVWVLVFQSHFIASLLLHALGQAADGDLSADAEAVENRNQNWNKKQARRKAEEDYSEWKYRWNSRHVTPCCDDVRKLGGAWGNLHCDRLEKHELLVHADGVGASCHVLQPERTVFFGDYCEEQNSGVRHAVDRPRNHCWDAVVLCQRSSLPAVTFNLIVDGDRGIGHPCPLHAVENSARHGKAHDAEYGLDPAQESQRYFSTRRREYNQIYRYARRLTSSFKLLCSTLKSILEGATSKVILSPL